MRTQTALRRTVYGALVSLVAGLALLAGCSSEQPQGVVTLVVPTRIGVQTADIAGVYESVAQYFAGAGLKMDDGRSDRPKGAWVSRSTRCAPNGDQRHVAECIVTAGIAPSTENPTQVAVDVKVRVGKLVEYDAEKARDQISIEPTLDRIVTTLRAKYGLAEVAKTDSLVF